MLVFRSGKKKINRQEPIRSVTILNHEELSLIDLLQPNRPYERLAQHQLIRLHGKRPNERETIEQEWHKRYSMPFPYSVNCGGRIIKNEVEYPSEESLPTDILQARDRYMNRANEKTEVRQSGRTLLCNS